MTEWQPIETAPRDGRELLLISMPGKAYGIGSYRAEIWWDWPWSMPPSHWLPLPPPPT